MKLTSEQLLNLRWLRKGLTEEIDKSGGVQAAFRSPSVKFEERKARLLMDKLKVCLPGDRVLSVYDLVSIDPRDACKWTLLSKCAELRETFSWAHGLEQGEHYEVMTKMQLLQSGSPNLFRVVAFVLMFGEVKGGMCCEGMFCALYQIIDSARHNGHICCGQEIGQEKGKVMLYPIECLVPVTAPSKTEKPLSISDEYAAELEWIRGGM